MPESWCVVTFNVLGENEYRVYGNADTTEEQARELAKRLLAHPAPPGFTLTPTIVALPREWMPDA
jgi:hypothetical protein